LAPCVDQRKLLGMGDERNGRSGFGQFAERIIIACLTAAMFAALLLLACQFVSLYRVAAFLAEAVRF
jgi:hypothetical protein